jgi:hypothetical protein
MVLTAELLHKLEQYYDEDGPDLVTSFVLQQQALHEHNDPEISETSGKVRDSDHSIRDYRDRHHAYNACNRTVQCRYIAHAFSLHDWDNS